MLEAAVQGAIGGALAGAAIGILPLLFILYLGDRKRAVFSFLACIIASAVGGYIGAIVAAGMFSAEAWNKKKASK